MSIKVNVNSVNINGVDIDKEIVKQMEATAKVAAINFKEAYVAGVEASIDMKPKFSTTPLRPSFRYSTGGVTNRLTAFVGEGQSVLFTPDDEYFSMPPLVVQLSKYMQTALAKVGLHEDILDKVTFVLKKRAGMDVLLRLSPKQIVDTETVVQTLLTVYDEMLAIKADWTSS